MSSYRLLFRHNKVPQIAHQIFLQFTVAPHMVQTSFVRGFFGRTIRGRKIQGIYLYFCLYLLGLVLSLVRAAAMTKGHTQKLSAESEHNLHRCSQQEWRRQVRLGQDSLAIYLSSCILNKHGRKITESYIFDTTNINSLVTGGRPPPACHLALNGKSFPSTDLLWRWCWPPPILILNFTFLHILFASNQCDQIAIAFLA